MGRGGAHRRAPPLRNGSSAPGPSAAKFDHGLLRLAELVDTERDHIAGLEDRSRGFLPMPTPGGVPVVMMSPGSSVISVEQ